MQEAKELFLKGDLLKSEKLFWQEYDSSSNEEDKILCLDYIYSIYQKNNFNISEESFLLLLNGYLKLSYFDKAKDLLEKIKKPSFALRMQYVEILWLQKNLAKFDDVAHELGQDLLAAKKYVIAKEYFLNLCEKRKWYLYPYFFILINCLELGDEINAKKIALEIENLILNKWTKVENKKKGQKEYIVHLRTILESYPRRTADLNCYLKILELKCAVLNKTRLSKKVIIELIIISKQEPEILIFLKENLKNEKISSEIEMVVDNKIYKKVLDKDNPFKDIYLKKNTKIKKLDVSLGDDQYYPRSYNVEDSNDLYDPSIFEAYLKGEPNEDNGYSDRLLKQYIKLNKDEYQNIKLDLITGLMTLGLMESAEALIPDIQDIKIQCYIKTEVLLKKKEYALAVAAANEIVFQKEIDIEQKIPFYYLKALALQGLGKVSESQNIYSLISTYHPNFRLVMERLGHE
jgi:hypothetical protein